MKKKRLAILIFLGVLAAAAVVALGLALNQKPTTTAVVLEVRTGLERLAQPVLLHRPNR